MNKLKKTFAIILAFCIGGIIAGCPGKITNTYITIKSAYVLLYSFNEYGVYPYTEEFNKNELGIGVWSNSFSESVDVVQAGLFSNSAYAMENPNKIIYTNAIDSINVFTIYDFDEKHPAGSNVNDILLYLDSMGKTKEVDINKLSSIDHNFKFSAIPENDSLQFIVTGRITNEGEFNLKTELVILQ